MISLQDEMNSQINPDWRNAGYNYIRASWVECAELVEHYNYKWWKKQVRDIPQCQMELVDIWHFILSHLIREGLSAEDMLFYIEDAADFEDALEGCEEDMTVLELIEFLVLALLQHEDTNLPDGEHIVTIFFTLCSKLDLSFDELYSQYIGKNVLNFFRQDNGYKEGTYIKNWNGKEDNEVLSDILNSTSKDVDNIREYIYSKLDEVYVTIKYS